MAKFQEYPISTRLQFLGQSIFQFLLAVFVTSTVWLLAYNSDWNRYHTWHIFLSTVGFAFFMSEAISFLNDGNSFVAGASKKTRNLLHGFCMVLATIAVVVGIALKIQDKTNNNRQHFTSVHGKLGLAALILTLVAFVGGFVVYFANVFYKTLGIKPLWVRILHTLVGCSAYLIGSIALGYGVYDYFSLASRYARTGLTVILGIHVILNILMGPVKSLVEGLF